MEELGKRKKWECRLRNKAGRGEKGKKANYSTYFER